MWLLNLAGIAAFGTRFTRKIGQTELQPTTRLDRLEVILQAPCRRFARTSNDTFGLESAPQLVHIRKKPLSLCVRMGQAPKT